MSFRDPKTGRFVSGHYGTAHANSVRELGIVLDVTEVLKPIYVFGEPSIEVFRKPKHPWWAFWRKG